MKKLFLLAFAWIALCFAIYAAYGQAYCELDIEATEVVKKNYSELFKGGWIIVFSDTTWCPPCRTYLPVIKSVEKTHQVKKYKPVQHALLTEYFEIESWPTTIIFVNGSEHSRKVGLQSKRSLTKMKGFDFCKKPEPEEKKNRLVELFVNLFGGQKE